MNNHLGGLNVYVHTPRRKSAVVSAYPQLNSSQPPNNTRCKPPTHQPKQTGAGEGPLRDARPRRRRPAHAHRRQQGPRRQGHGRGLRHLRRARGGPAVGAWFCFVLLGKMDATPRPRVVISKHSLTTNQHTQQPHRQVEFVQQLGLDYTSCSPYRVPIARIAAAQAAIRAEQQK